MTTERIRRGDVFWARFAVFPHEPAAPGKERPVVALQNDEDNEDSAYPLIVVVPVSTQKVERVYRQDVVLPRGTGGLSEDSKVLNGLVRTIPKRDLIRRLGHLPRAKIEQVNLKLLRQLGFLER